MAEEPTRDRDNVASNRANVYYALARALDPPANWSHDLPGLLAGALEAIPGHLAELGQKLESRAVEILEDGEQAAVDHAKLFLGPFEILAAPWATFYLENETQLMGTTSQYVAQKFADAGLGPSEGLKDAPDHVTHELEFMYYLAFNEATTGENEWSERRESFWREHLGRWLPLFADALVQARVDPFYGVVAEALKELCVIENEAMENAPDGTFR